MFRFARIRPVTNRVLVGAVSLLFCCLSTPCAFAASCEDYTATPPFLTTSVKPNVVFMLDNSGSMKEPVSSGGWDSDCSGSIGTGYNNDQKYYGIFDSAATYKYNPKIPVDKSPYDGTADAPYDVKDTDGNVLIDSTATGAFVAATCTPAAGVNCWQGNFLNWLTTRKIDAARKVLVGGKVENRSGYDYLGNSSTTWKIVGNNEPSDKSVCKKYASGQDYSPYPDNTKLHLFSPANDGEVKTSYDPYAKLKAIATALPATTTNIHDKNGVIVGEYGEIKQFNHTSQVINFSNSYEKPIVIVKPLTRNGADPSIIRVSAVTSSSFTLQIQEWGNGTHTNEAATYFVFDKGTHTFSGPERDILLIAGSSLVNTEVDSWQTITTSGLSTPPVVLASVVSKNDATTVTTRIKSITSSQFQIAMQEIEGSSGHAAETVHFLAVEPGQFTDGNLVFSAGKESGFSDAWNTLSFASMNAAAFIADLQTFTGSDTASLRYQNLKPGSVEIMVEEETVFDTETTHTGEDVGYLAVGFPKFYNVGLVVDAEPKGLVHEMSDKVRTGISFYRYQRDGDVYNNEWAHGGTFRLPIPANPFVKDAGNIPSYRLLETPIKSNTAVIVDAIEHYPLVWGTTPLAENLYEVGQYFKQLPPYYDDKPNINNETAYRVNNDWDPYYYTIDGVSQKVSCAKSFVILLTDGLPFRDDYVPPEIVGLSGVANDDYDVDNKTDINDGRDSDCSQTGDTDDQCRNNLDDVASYLCWEKPEVTYQDLRPTTDLSGKQHLEIFTVAFGSKTIPQILQDTAENANGTAYAAEDGEQLAVALTSAINSILKRTSAGSSVSVLSERATTGALINQAIFFPQKTFADGSDTYDVSWLGALNAYWFYNSRTVSNIRENSEDLLGYYTLDIFKDKILNFEIDDEGSLKIEYFKAINNGSYNDGAADPNSGPGGTAGPEGIYQTIDDVKKIFEPGEILKDRVVAADPNLVTDSGRRYIYATTESGTTEELVQSKVSDFEGLFNLIATDIPACLGTVDNAANQEAAAKNLISYIRGAADDFSAQANIDQPCRNRKVDNAGNIWKLGDIIYSTPRVVNYDTGSDKFSLLFTGANDGMLHAFKLGRLRKDKAGTGQAVALCDSNNGDCTNNEIGEEAWTVIPRNAMPYLKYLADPNYKHIYTVDLPPYLIETEDKKILIGGMRFGGATGCTNNQNDWCGDINNSKVGIDVDDDGTPLQAVPPESDPALDPPTITDSTLGLSSYFAIDVTDPYKPVFLWEFTDPSMGYSYSGPAVISRKVGATTKKYVMFLSGPLSNKGGASPGQDLKIYILKLDPNDFTIDHVYKLDGKNESGFTKENALSNLDSAFGGRLFTDGIDYNSDGSTDAVFFGVNWLTANDWKGNVFLVAPTDDDPVTTNNNSENVNWEIGKVFNDGQAPITAKIEHGVCYDNNYLYFGSGRWFYKTDTRGQNENDTNSLWGIEIDECLAKLSDGDDSTKCTTTLNRAHNGNIADKLCAADGTLSTGGELSWQMTGMEPNTGGAYFMERTITDPTYASNIAFFTTMQPSSDLCDFGGRTRIWGFNCRTGHNMWGGCSNVKMDPPPGALLLQLSGGNIEDSQLKKDKFSQKDNLATEWFKGVPPESATPFVPFSGKLNGEILLWIER